MASAEEHLTTDSVPDPPRAEASHSDSSRNSDSDDNHNSGRDESARGRNKGQKSPRTQEKKRRSSNSKAEPQPSFNIPRIKHSGASSMIYISNTSNVHFGNNINVNFVGQAYQSRPPKTPSPEPRSIEKPKEVKDTCKSNALVTNDDLDTVAEHVGKRWTKLGERLGYSEEQMERFHADHKDMGLKEVVYQMLLDWKRSKGPEALVGVLCHSLWGSRLHEAAKQLAAQYSGKSL